MAILKGGKIVYVGQSHRGSGLSHDSCPFMVVCLFVCCLGMCWDVSFLFFFSSRLSWCVFSVLPVLDARQCAALCAVVWPVCPSQSLSRSAF